MADSKWGQKINKHLLSGIFIAVITTLEQPEDLK
jgi:hypothetical protein